MTYAAFRKAFEFLSDCKGSPEVNAFPEQAPAFDWVQQLLIKSKFQSLRVILWILPVFVCVCVRRYVYNILVTPLEILL